MEMGAIPSLFRYPPQIPFLFVFLISLCRSFFAFSSNFANKKGSSGFNIT